MATYEEIYGKRVEVVSSDPSNLDAGQIWYNSTSGALKGYVLAPGTIASSGNLNTGRTQLGFAGTTPAGLIFGGESPSLTGATEEYNGSTWTNGGTCPAQKSDPHCSGTQTAGLWGGGSPSSAGSFEYNGTGWTAGGDMTFSGRDFTGGSAGTQTAALQVGGFVSPSSTVATMQTYDGSSWTNIPQSFPTAALTDGFATCGSQTAALSAGGPSAPVGWTGTYDWDGSSWTTLNSLNIGTSHAVHRGTPASSIFATGHPASPPSYSNEIQTFDGTNWSTSPATLATARAQAAGGGPSTSAFFTGGRDSPGPLTSTEIYTGPALATKTLTIS